jgi:hypothetical protein
MRAFGSSTWGHVIDPAALPARAGRLSVIAVGGTRSGALDSLWMEGPVDLTVVEHSEAALQDMKCRLGPLSKYIAWMQANVLHASLPQHAFDVWLDQGWHATLSSEAERAQYMAQVRRAVRPGGAAFVDGKLTSC